jgi:hypothetical protein
MPLPTGAKRQHAPVKIPDPPDPRRYLTLKPQFEAFRAFYSFSGQQDTLINMIELALRSFENQMSGEDDKPEFVKRKCIEMHVNSSLGVPWISVRRNSWLLMITQALSAIESFIDDLSREYKAFNKEAASNWKTQAGDKQLDGLATLVSNLPKVGAKIAKKCPEYDLLQYYRAVRNWYIHAGQKDLSRQHLALLQSHKEYLTATYGAVANGPADVNYGDFMLLTTAAKNYAKVLNDACNLTGIEIATGLLAQPQFVARLRLAKKSPTATKRFASAVGRSYACDAIAASEVSTTIIAFAESDPRRSLRRRDQSNREGVRKRLQ